MDASATVELLLQSRKGLAVSARLAAPAETVHAPQLLWIEVPSALRRLAVVGDLSEDRAGQALADLSDLAIEAYDHRPLVGRIWELRDNLSPYDATYVALAEGLGAPLLTSDARLGRGSGHDAEVLVL